MTSFHSNDRNRFRPTVEEHANERCCNEAAQFPEVGLGSWAAVPHNARRFSTASVSRPSAGATDAPLECHKGTLRHRAHHEPSNETCSTAPTE